MMTDQSVSDASVVAHWGAYKKGIIHGDISDGNVLILPVEKVGPDGKLRVSRIGMLADWELSKRVHDDGDTPRQLDCTVCIPRSRVKVVTDYVAGYMAVHVGARSEKSVTQTDARRR